MLLERILNLFKKGQDVQGIFDEVAAYTQYINQIYTAQELSQTKAQLIPVKILLEKQDIPEVKESIAKNTL